MKTIELKKKTILELSVLITEESKINKSAFCNSLIKIIMDEFPRNKKHSYIDFESFQCFENNQIVVRDILRSCLENKVDKIHTIGDLLPITLSERNSLSVSIKFVKNDNSQEFLNIELYKLVPTTISDNSEDTPSTIRKLNTNSLYRRLMSYLKKGDDR